MREVDNFQFKQFDFTVAGNRIIRVKQRWGTRKLDPLRPFNVGY